MTDKELKVVENWGREMRNIMVAGQLLDKRYESLLSNDITPSQYKNPIRQIKKNLKMTIGSIKSLLIDMSFHMPEESWEMLKKEVAEDNLIDVLNFEDKLLELGNIEQALDVIFYEEPELTT